MNQAVKQNLIASVSVAILGRAPDGALFVRKVVERPRFHLVGPMARAILPVRSVMHRHGIGVNAARQLRREAPVLCLADY